ncbi:HAMP domain-containing sensor histidine kinase [Streptomyces sp. NPDC046685]|uniref:HAMP domain-containing sensor histidine kinase n=1 Tax=Streptomyces sp. NPDC046685 TaxID=3157202 RepID=UPI00340985ED
MRRRLLVTYLTLTAVLLLVLEVPLCFNLAMNEFHHAVFERTDEAEVLAARISADPAALSWRQPVSAYETAHPEAAVWLFDASGHRLYTGHKELHPAGAWQGNVDRALAGERTAPLDYPFSTTGEPLLVVVPLARGSERLGAVAVVAPMSSLRDRMAAQAALLLGIAVAGLAASALAAIPLARWSVLPVLRLHAAVRQITKGRYGVRAATDDGPAEVRELAQGVNEMTQRLVALLEAQRGFVANVSHQMRNPLAALSLRVQALEAVVPADGRHALTLALEETARLGRILDELLQLAQGTESASGTIAVSVREVVEQRARAWSQAAEEKDVTLAVTGDRVVGRALPGALDQVLDVLLDNALGFSPAEGRIVIRTSSDGEWVRIAVEDEGPGLPARDRENAPHRFWRGAQPDDREGSGLGLAIATALLEAGGGRLTLADAVPHGLIACADLPAERALPQGPPAASRFTV